MRDGGWARAGSNFGKSTWGHGGRLKGSAPPPLDLEPAAAAAAGPRARAPLTNACTSACRMRPFGPLACTRVRSAPSSGANLRTEGLACGFAAVSSRGSAGTGAGDAAAAALAAGAEGAAFGASALVSVLGSARCSAVSSTRIAVPCDTLSPVLMRISFTTPAAGDGISIVALSDSSVTSDCSFSTLSPGFTSTSITSTSLKSPMSGTATLCGPDLDRPPADGGVGGRRRAGGSALKTKTPRSLHSLPPLSGGRKEQRSYGCRIRLLGIDTVFLDRVGNQLRLYFALIGQRLQRRDGDEVAIDLEEMAQLGARVGTAEAVGAEHAVGAVFRDERPDLVGEGLDVIGCGDHGSRRALVQAFGDIGNARLGFRMQHVPALGREAVAAQLGEAGRAPHVRGHAPVLLEELGGSFDFAQDRAGAHQLDAALGFRFGIAQEVHALQDAGLDTLRHRRVLVVLVHQGDVVIDILLVRDHAAQPVLDDDGELIAVGRVVRDAVRDGRGEDVRVSILVLQALAVQRGASGGGAEQEAARALVGRRPGEIADALHAEHRVKDVERHRHFVRVAVRSGRS